MYQYAGNTCAIFNTNFGSSLTDKNAPHRKADPKATTLTIPLIASLDFNRDATKKARLVAQSRYKKELIM